LTRAHYASDIVGMPRPVYPLSGQGSISLGWVGPWSAAIDKLLSLDVEPDRAHEPQGITGLDDSPAQTMVKP
jgi:hypothetical protein